tara:strand:+ start:6326 stop:6775 length:450 start_codon:yes stop_codon:yes gene_type:complete
MVDYHIAQINIALARSEMTDEIMSGFVARLDEINALADISPGFIWRLQSDEGDATAIRVFDDPLLLINMSVWADIESLKNYVYRSAHVELIQDREAWFKKMVISHQALWWVPKDHIPTVEDGKEKLDLLEREGPSALSFTFSRPYSQPQ